MQLWRTRDGQTSVSVSVSPSLACRRPRADHSKLPSIESKRGVNPTHTEPQPDTARGKHHRGETAQGQGGNSTLGNPPANTHPTASPPEEGRGATTWQRWLKDPRTSALNKRHPPLLAHVATGQPRFSTIAPYIHSVKIRRFSDTPTFFSAGKATARRSSSAAQPMRTAAARIAPHGPPADVEQAGGRRADRIGRQLAAESSAARNARSGPNGWTSAGPPRKLKVGSRGQRMHIRMDVRDKPSLRREDSAQ